MSVSTWKRRKGYTSNPPSIVPVMNDRLDRTDMNWPFVIVSFDNQGNFSTFDPELLSVKTERYGNFFFGNVLNLKDSLESVCYTERFQAIYRDMQAGRQQCQATCEYFGVCGGGAGSNKYWKNGTLPQRKLKPVGITSSRLRISC